MHLHILILIWATSHIAKTCLFLQRSSSAPALSGFGGWLLSLHRLSILNRPFEKMQTWFRKFLSLMGWPPAFPQNNPVLL
jgi:hypothetical protein